MEPKTLTANNGTKKIRPTAESSEDTLASKPADNPGQKKIPSEQKETSENALFQKISETMKSHVDNFRSFARENSVNIISNTFNSSSIGYQKNYNPEFNSIDQILELHEDTIGLYERMLKERDEKLEKLVKLAENGE